MTLFDASQRGRRSRRMAVALTGLFALVTALLFSTGSVTDATTLLYVVPVALAGVEFGLRAGLAAGACALALFSVWAQAKGTPVTVVGYSTRAIAFLVLGGLVGGLADRNAVINREREELLVRVQALAQTDELTSLPNRRAWDEAVQREIDRAERQNSELSLAMIDLDEFKSVNDKGGHHAGDRLLTEAAAGWRTAIRRVDFLARIGGDEFALLLPSCPQSYALQVVERVRAALPSGHTCSAGIVAWHSGESPDQIVRRADEALYEAKRGGRDTTVSAPLPASPLRAGSADAVRSE